MTITKRSIMDKLPISKSDYIIRETARADIDNYAEWPDYTGYKAMFNSSLKESPMSKREIRWNNYLASDNSLGFVVDTPKTKTAGRFNVIDIDWSTKVAGNMSIRVHPDYCDKGLGTKVLKDVVQFCFDCGLKEINLDVLKSNHGAVRCYEKVGFEFVEEFERDGGVFLSMRVMGE